MKREATVAVIALALVPTWAGADSFPAAFVRIENHYEAFRRGLVNDSTKDLSQHCEGIAEAARGLESRGGGRRLSAADAHELPTILPTVVATSRRLSGATTLERAREFSGELSRAFIDLRSLALGRHVAASTDPTRQLPAGANVGGTSSVPGVFPSGVGYGIGSRSRHSVVVFCPMAKRWWVQPAGELGNPYLGKDMAHCGLIVTN